jgi:hypothetical protein
MTISKWPKYPSIYEINAWVWVSDLSRKYGSAVDLSCVPSSDWDLIAQFGFDGVWLMGVWERSPAGIAIANHNESLLEDFRRALPDFHPRDIVGSPYCVRRYVVDDHLGGTAGLAIARRELAKRGMNLILDFVPNHLAPDHPWVMDHPEYFVQGNAYDVRNDPESWVELNGNVYARGRDPYFPAWPDVLQLNAFQPQLRQAVVETLLSIASQCDGVRCDMAMLLLDAIFQRTWGPHAGSPLAKEYWVDVIARVKKSHPGFLFIGEAYWDMEWNLQQQGFDFCYDKKLYDRLECGSAESVRNHLGSDLAYQKKLVRFIENHDEPRAATAFSQAKERAAVVAMATIPGAKLFQEGQFEGRKVRLPVFLGRRPEEPPDRELQAFYARNLKVINSPVFREGQWSLCEREDRHLISGFENLLAWSWLKENYRCIVVVNLSACAVQARVQIPWGDERWARWRLADASSEGVHDRNGHEMLLPGLYLELGPWDFHFFQCVCTTKGKLYRAVAAGA